MIDYGANTEFRMVGIHATSNSDDNEDPKPFIIFRQLYHFFLTKNYTQSISKVSIFP